MGRGYISGLSPGHFLGVYRELMCLSSYRDINHVGQKNGKRVITGMPGSMTRREAVREPWYAVPSCAIARLMMALMGRICTLFDSPLPRASITIAMVARY